MYHFFDEENVELKGDSPEQTAIYNGKKRELTIFYCGVTQEAHTDIKTAADALSIYDEYLEAQA